MTNSKNNVVDVLNVDGDLYQSDDIKHLLKENQAFKNVFKNKFGITEQELNDTLGIKVDQTTKNTNSLKDTGVEIDV